MPFLVPSINSYTPTTGQTISIPNGSGNILVMIKPTTDLASLEIGWPPNPVKFQKVLVMCTKNIASISHSGGDVSHSTASLDAMCCFEAMWDAPSNKWHVGTMCHRQPLIAKKITGTVSGGAGNCVVYFTSNGLSGGTPLFEEIDVSIAQKTLANPNIDTATPDINADNKTVTTYVARRAQVNTILVLFGGISVVTGENITAAPDGTSINVTAIGTPYLG